MTLPLELLDSITDAGADSAGRIVICGSHGGLYPAAVASQAAVAAVVFNDAGVGCQQAGVRGVLALDDCAIPAAAVDCMSAEIGSAKQTLEHGVLSTVNRTAAALGLGTGMRVAEAGALLQGARPGSTVLPPVAEARQERQLQGLVATVLCVDSASLVQAGDRQRIVVTGSHGGLIGGDPARALKAEAALAVFNDAGCGKNKAGITRLPALDQRGVPALTVDCNSAMIGNAESTLQSGIVSHCNALAGRHGIAPGDTLLQAIARIAGTEQ